jgi:hypothetical protein
VGSIRADAGLAELLAARLMIGTGLAAGAGQSITALEGQALTNVIVDTSACNIQNITIDWGGGAAPSPGINRRPVREKLRSSGDSAADRDSGTVASGAGTKAAPNVAVRSSAAGVAFPRRVGASFAFRSVSSDRGVRADPCRRRAFRARSLQSCAEHAGSSGVPPVDVRRATSPVLGMDVDPRGAVGDGRAIPIGQAQRIAQGDQLDVAKARAGGQWRLSSQPLPHVAHRGLPVLDQLDSACHPLAIPRTAGGDRRSSERRRLRSGLCNVRSRR